ncbi:MAG: hypothetical protein V1928_01520 [Parcubacteria group bacterium]
MTSIEEKFESIVEQDFPNELHERIMKSVVFIRRFRIYCRSVAVFFSIALVFSAERLGKLLLENEFFTVCRVLLGGMEKDYDIIMASLGSIAGSLPLPATLMFSIMLVLTFVMLIGLRRFNRSSYYLNKMSLKIS